MRANRELRLVHRRPGRFFGPSDRTESVELIHIATSETVFLWDLAPADARRFAGELKRDLARYETEDVLARWDEISSAEDLTS